MLAEQPRRHDLDEFAATASSLCWTAASSASACGSAPPTPICSEGEIPDERGDGCRRGRERRARQHLHEPDASPTELHRRARSGLGVRDALHQRQPRPDPGHPVLQVPERDRHPCRAHLVVHGQPLATITFTNEASSGWQQQALATPLTINAGTTYVVSVNTNGYYAFTSQGFASIITNGGLTAPVGAGVYNDNRGRLPSPCLQ